MTSSSPAHECMAGAGVCGAKQDGSCVLSGKLALVVSVVWARAMSVGARPLRVNSLDLS